MENKESHGILYCAVGSKYEKQAIHSYSTALKLNTSLKASIYTDIKTSEKLWDNIMDVKYTSPINFENQMVHKLDAILSTPYEQTLFLDTDTMVLDDLSELFLLLEKYDIVLCHGHNRNQRYNEIQNATSDSGEPLFLNTIPYCFAPLQSGLILYNKHSTIKFFQEVRSLYLSRGYYDDQAVIRELLWTSRIQFYILPPEYNFNSLSYMKKLQSSQFRIASPKLFHYTLNKRDDLKYLFSRANKLRVVKKGRLSTLLRFLKVYYRKILGR